MFFALNATHQTASRLTWSFARDDALFGSRWLGQIDSRQQVPIAALLFNFAIMFIIGCIYLGSTSAFNAFIGTGLILQHVTYAFPAALLMIRRRAETWLPKSRSFQMPSIVGWAANITTVLFAVLVLVFYDFPTVLPVSGTSMSKYKHPLSLTLAKFSCRLRICSDWSDDIVHRYELVWTCCKTISRPTSSHCGRMKTKFESSKHMNGLCHDTMIRTLCVDKEPLSATWSITGNQK